MVIIIIIDNIFQHSYLRRFLLAIYLTVILIITAVLIVIIVMAPIEEHWVYKEAKKLLVDDH